MDPSTAQATNKLMSKCVYYGNAGIATPLPAVAMLTNDNRINVYTYDPEKLEYTGVIVETDTSTITKAMVNSSMLSFQVGKTSYTFDFDPEAYRMFIGGAAASTAAKSVLGTLPGAAVGVGAAVLSDQMNKDSDIAKWSEALTTAGVTFTKNTTYLGLIIKLTGISLLVLAVIIIGAFIITEYIV